MPCVVFDEEEADSGYLMGSAFNGSEKPTDRVLWFGRKGFDSSGAPRNATSRIYPRRYF